MDLSYDMVASKCAAQMAKYQECVLKNDHGDWANICRPEGRALAACADDSVPHLSELKNTCAQPISTYRACLDKNASLSNETISEICAEPLKELWECSERTMAKIEGREGNASESTTTSNNRPSGPNGGRLV